MYKPQIRPHHTSPTLTKNPELLSSGFNFIEFDLIGDLYLAGVNPLNLKAQIIVKEAGHAVHVKVAKKLKDSMQKAMNKESEIKENKENIDE